MWRSWLYILHPFTWKNIAKWVYYYNLDIMWTCLIEWVVLDGFKLFHFKLNIKEITCTIVFQANISKIKGGVPRWIFSKGQQTKLS